MFLKAAQSPKVPDTLMNILASFLNEISSLAEPAADKMYGFIQKYVPKHMMGEYRLFVQQTSNGLIDGIIEKCIELGTIVPPGNWLSAEGVIMTVKK